MNSWKKVWSLRSLGEYDQITLDKLISLDGFDTGYGTITTAQWLKYTDYIYGKFQNDVDSIYEVGCGAGAFLYPFFKRGITVAGCDYSESLVNIARLHLPANNFAFCDANNINTDLKFNLVVSNSVFFYFPSYEYAEEVLKRMIHKSSKYIYVLEVSDMDYRDESIRLRKGY